MINNNHNGVTSVLADVTPDTSLAPVLAPVAAPRLVALRPATVERIRALLAQQQALQVRITETVFVALEAMDVPGEVQGYDPRTGLVTVAG